MPGANKKCLTVFYSWKSDREQSCCKKFIRTAAEDAAKRLSVALGIDVKIESDTENVPGTPPITDTILRKIEECDLFLGDMTFVAQTGSGKNIPNPNVMGEYGYAQKCKGTERILLAMNTAFGDPKDLPFDLRHLRHPAQYALPEGAIDGLRRSTREKFSAKLEKNLHTAINSILGKPQVPIYSNSWEEAEKALLRVAALPPPVPVRTPKLVVQVVPLAALLDPSLPAATVKAARSHFALSIDESVSEGSDETKWWSHGPARRIPDRLDRKTDWLFLFARPGTFQVSINIGHRIYDDPTITVKGHDIERHLVKAVDQCAFVAQSVGLGGPALVSASMEGLDDVEMSSPRPSPRSRRIRRESIVLGTTKLQFLNAPSADQLHELMEKIWFIGGWDDGSPYIANGHWSL